jgi:hypothetical protein
MPEEKQRALRQVEIDLAKTVFFETLPYNRILIGDGFSLIGGSAWMESADMPGIGTGDYYVLHMGGVGYQDCTATAKIYGEGNDRQVKTVFIHELTHVWQAFHGRWVFSNSMFSQACAIATTGDRSNAYSYESGLEWSDYNVEQQASIVEDWFVGGKREDIVLYEYIRDHIRNC